MSLTFGLINSISHILMEVTTFSLLVNILSPMVSLAIAFISYQIILNFYLGANQNGHTFIFILTVPILLILLISQYITDSIYGRITIINDTNIIYPIINHCEMAIIQLVAFLSLFSILFAYEKLTNTFQMKTKLALLEQKSKFLQVYCEEDKSRYNQTRSFRHDIKSHLIVMDGLIQKGKLNEAHTYLKNLENTVTLFSFPCQSGNTVIDILLSSKLSLAYQNGIRVDCTIKIPPSFFVNDMDLCIVFSNAVDNAIKASNYITALEKYISISGKQQGSFFMVEFENSHSPKSLYKKGNGLGIVNIKAIAEKYEGAVQIEQSSSFFRLNILFHIPRHFNDISEHIH